MALCLGLAPDLPLVLDLNLDLFLALGLVLAITLVLGLNLVLLLALGMSLNLVLVICLGLVMYRDPEPDSHAKPNPDSDLEQK